MDVRKQRPIEKIRAKLIELDLPFTVSFDSVNYHVKDEQFKTVIEGRFDTVMILLRDNGAGLKAKEIIKGVKQFAETSNDWKPKSEPAPVQTELEAVPLMYDVKVKSKYRWHDDVILKTPVIPQARNILNYYANEAGQKNLRHWITTIESVTHRYDDKGNLIEISVYG